VHLTKQTMNAVSVGLSQMLQKSNSRAPAHTHRGATWFFPRIVLIFFHYFCLFDKGLFDRQIHIPLEEGKSEFQQALKKMVLSREPVLDLLFLFSCILGRLFLAGRGFFHKLYFSITLVYNMVK